MVAMNAQTYKQDLAEVSPGGFLIYDSTWPRERDMQRDDVTVLGVPLARLANENFSVARVRILMKNVAYVGVLAALLDIDLDIIRELLRETFASKPKLVDSNLKAIMLGYDYAMEQFTCPLPVRAEKMDGNTGRVLIEGNAATALGAVYAGATVGAWYPITPSTSVMDAFKSYCDMFRNRSGNRRAALSASSRPKMNWPRPALCSAPTGRVQARIHTRHRDRVFH